MTTKIDGMGLFGYVLNGTVKNLTVDNFSCDGEFTPTGVIAAYAVNSTFENIAVTNCNPGVYNTGNGGIVGIGGNSDDEKFFKNHRPKSGGDFFLWRQDGVFL